MELNEIISVIKAKGFRSAIGVVTRKGGVTDVNYPLYLGSKEVTCGSTGYSNDNVTTIRPATEEEIKAWRNAEGVAKSARKTANTAEKVKAIKWVACSLRLGGEIINEL